MTDVVRFLDPTTGTEYRVCTRSWLVETVSGFQPLLPTANRIVGQVMERIANGLPGGNV